MVAVWISPQGDWKNYVAGSNATHIELATEIFLREAEAGRIDREEYGPPSQTHSQALLSNEWVRYSNGYVEGQPDAIRKHWDTVRDFMQSDTLHLGYHAKVFFDINDDRGRVIRDFQITLEAADKPVPPAAVFREPSDVQKFRRRESPKSVGVRVRSHRRRG